MRVDKKTKKRREKRTVPPHRQYSLHDYCLRGLIVDTIGSKSHCDYYVLLRSDTLNINDSP